MRTYVITTGILFAALAALHVYVTVERWGEIARDPWPAVALVVSAALSLWALRVLRSARP